MQAHPLASLMGLLVLALATYWLSVLIGDMGLHNSGDGRLYFGAALNLVETGELVISKYSPETGPVLDPLTHFPPLPSLTYALLMMLGVSAHTAPVVVALVCWPLFLLGVGVLTWRLGGSAGVAVCAMALAALTYHYLKIYVHIRSETIFLPLLVFAVAALVDLPKQKERPWRGLAVASALLALLMLTRYSGGFVWLAVGTWWLGRRLWQGFLSKDHWKTLLGELAVLGAAVIPLFLWLVRNALVGTGVIGGRHLQGSRFSLVDGFRATLAESFQTLWPAVRSEGVAHALGLEPFFLQLEQATGLPGGHLLLLPLPLVALLAWGAWRYRARLKGYLLRSPIEGIVAVYLVGVYGFLQPFMDFLPLDVRDMATALCLLQSFALGALAVALRSRWSTWLAGGYVALNAALLALVVFHQGRPPFIELAPPKIESVAGQSEYAAEILSKHHMPYYLVLAPWRSRALERYHPELLERLAPGTFVYTNRRARRLFTPHPIRSSAWVGDFMEDQACELEADQAVVLFTWDEWRLRSPEWERKMDQRCPGLSKAVLSGSILYRAPGAQLRGGPAATPPSSDDNDYD